MLPTFPQSLRAVTLILAALLSFACALGAQAPTAQFDTSLTSGFAPLEVTFTDLSSGAVDARSWDFGDGTVSSDTSPTHVFTEPGLFTVTLSVSGADGSNTIASEGLVQVNAPLPTADFGLTPSEGQTPHRVTFEDRSTGWIDGWAWDFGDGQHSTEASPEHLYTLAGLYTVRLVVTGPGGSDTKVREAAVQVVEAAPLAALEATPTAGTAPLVVQFEDRSAGVVTGWLWDFGDGAGSQNPSPSHTYAQAGLYHVSLTASGPGGVDTQVFEQTIEVRAGSLHAEIEVDVAAGEAPLRVRFADRSTGEIESWHWEFGDGSTSSDPSPTHLYTSGGDFTYTLEVQGPGGLDQVSGTVQVETAPLVADFSLDPATGNFPLTVSFQNLSTGAVTEWQWSFGDGAGSTEPSPVHVYQNEGVFDVSLTVSSADDTQLVQRTGLVTVSRPLPPSANFGSQVRIGESPLDVTFDSQATGQVDTFLWDFGDGSTSSEATPAHTYSQPGTYSVQLTVQGPGGVHSQSMPGFVSVVSPLRPAGGLTAGRRSRPALAFIPNALDFGAVRLGTQSTPETVTVRNTTAGAVSLTQLFLQGAGAAEFQLVLPSGTSLPVNLAAGTSVDIAVIFNPTELGEAAALMRAPTPSLNLPPSFLRVSGVSLDVLGNDLRVDCLGVTDYVDTAGETWVSDFGDVGGSWQRTLEPIAGTLDDALYQDQRRGGHFAYRFPVLETGVYEVRFHFAEIAGLPEGARRFDVTCEGTQVIVDLDITSEAGGVATALVIARPVEVIDGVLDIDFQSTVGEASVAAIEVRGVPFLDAGVLRHDFGAVAAGSSASQILTLQNRGVLPATPTFLTWSLGDSGTADSFVALVQGTSYAGTSGVAAHALSTGVIAPGGTLAVELHFSPTAPRYDVAQLSISGDFAPVEVQVSGLGGHEGDPYLHVVIVTPEVVLDYDQDGSEPVVIDGSGSHTHEPGRAITAFGLNVDGSSAGSQPISVTALSVGTHDIEFSIADDGTPQRTLTNSTTVEVRPISRAPGVLFRYYDASSTAPTTLIDALPSSADFAEEAEFAQVAVGATVGGSSFTGLVVVELVGGFDVTQAGTYAILPTGGQAQRLQVDGTSVTSAVVLQPGAHTIRVLWAVNDLNDLPLGVSMAQVGVGSFDPSPLHYNLGSVSPVISGMTTTGSTSGGNLVVINGLGFFPTPNVVVHWGGVDLYAGDFERIDANSIELRTPSMAAGPISVTVQSPLGTSNVRTFIYDTNGPAPIQFQEVLSLGVPNPTAGAFGPDGRFYMTALDGRLTVVEFSTAWAPVSVTTYPGVSGLNNSDTTGLVFDPYDHAQPVRVYVAHGKHYQNGGGSFTGTSAYTGQVSLLLGPTFDAPIPVITGLPVSNHDHSVNAVVFDEAGDLLVSVGSMTNAGVRHPNSGDLPESPLSAAIIRARLSDPNFDGAVSYVDSVTGLPSTDQVFGSLVDLAAGGFIDVYARGVRHSFDMVLTTQGRIYATDNGPNIGFGATSTGPNSESPDPYDDDELLLIERGLFYGAPNRNRGRTNSVEDVYRGGSVGSTVPHTFRQRAGWLPPSCNGIDEFRSDVFGGAMRGDLVIQQWRSFVRRAVLTDDGRRMQGLLQLDPYTGGLALETGPGGALISLDYTNGRMRVLVPVEAPSTSVEIADITPWRASPLGGTRFVLAGRNFGSVGNTSVTIGGLPVGLISVEPTRIVGTFPARPATDEGLLDVVVTVSGASDVHEAAVRILPGRGQHRERWEQVLPQVPVQVGEVATAEIDGILYLVGEGTPVTLRFDMEARTWLNAAAQRPYVGDHHAAEVIDGKLYLVGGFQGGSEGRLQIYDPATDTWIEGAPMSWAGGSVSTAVIAGKLYAAGGIVNTWTVNNMAVYDPLTDAWTSLPAMPVGRNHSAFGTDGSRLWIFGGREGGNWVQNGFANVQVFNPVTSAWEDSDDPTSSIEPLPFGRGGMGHAIFFEDEFYVFGGETQTGVGAVPGTNVYTRVDVYNATTNTWREATPMPTGRHGIDPFLYDRWIFLPGGGRQAGYSNSNLFEGLYLP